MPLLERFVMLTELCCKKQVTTDSVLNLSPGVRVGSEKVPAMRAKCINRSTRVLAGRVFDRWVGQKGCLKILLEESGE